MDTWQTEIDDPDVRKVISSVVTFVNVVGSKVVKSRARGCGGVSDGDVDAESVFKIEDRTDETYDAVTKLEMLFSLTSCSMICGQTSA